jgi:hydroxymethylbilane synthase
MWMAADRTRLTIGSRGSKLALWQSEYIRDRVQELTGLEVDIKIIKTTGDKILDVPLAKVGGKGLFTKEIEVELEAGVVDLAVHSMKDVPTELPEGLVIAAMPQRVDPRDVIVSGAGYTLDTLPQGGRVGTSSLRRVAQVRALRPDVEIVDVRGNLDTRMRKAENGEVDVVILAAAGITRLGWSDRITHYVSDEQMVSAVGQGAIGIEIREDDEFMQDACARLADADTMLCVGAERVVMRTLEGGCQVPIGAYARLVDGMLVMDGVVGSVDGTEILRAHVEGDATGPDGLAHLLVDELLALGAAEILAEVRSANVVPEPPVDPRLETY